MKHQLKKLNQGFTIIEVLIVLAIAGLILAIVFLAVPALQRNSRNTGIRSDAAAVLAGVNDFISNNNGSLPANAASQTGPTIAVGTGTAAAEAKVRGGTTVVITACTSAGNCPAAPTTTGAIVIATQGKCNAGGTAAVYAPRAVAALFLVESTSTATPAQCIES